MTEDEIAGESGGTVSSRMVRGVRVLSGTGVIYGGTRSEPGVWRRAWFRRRPAESRQATVR